MSKSGRDQGSDNVKKLLSYLSSIDAIPARGGKAYMSGIAEACGFDRQILYKNPQAKKLLNEAIKHKGLKGIEARDGNTDAERIALERQITALQQTNSSLIAEVYDLRQKLKRFKHIEEMIELGIRVII